MSLDEDQKICGSITLGGLVTVLLCVAMIIIGCLNLDFNSEQPVEDGKCRVELNIPVFLITARILFIVMLVLRILFQRCCRKCADCGGDNKLCSSLNFACKFSCILIYDVLATCLFLAVLIVGTNWTFSVYDSVTFDYEGSQTYCPEYTYYFTVAVIILLWVMFALAITCGLLLKFCKCFYDVLCCKPCNNSDNQAV